MTDKTFNEELTKRCQALALSRDIDVSFSTTIIDAVHKTIQQLRDEGKGNSFSIALFTEKTIKNLDAVTVPLLIAVVGYIQNIGDMTKNNQPLMAGITTNHQYHRQGD